MTFIAFFNKGTASTETHTQVHAGTES
jgi:serine/threonine protein kinase